MELVLSSRNAHKLHEFGRILAPHTVLSLPEAIVLPPETGSTFAENALIKARAAALATGRPAFADDSGIAAVALSGAPGIYSARYAGEGATDEANLSKLLRSVPRGADRRVAYVCAIVYMVPGQVPHVFEERCHGLLAEEPRGSGGFGYDPAFLPLDIPDGRTMAELTAEEKDAISHRGKAARAFAEFLATQDGGTGAAARAGQLSNG
jgi:XTP/dITP diphosphohydrolase